MPLAGRRLGVYDKSSGGYMIPAPPVWRVAPMGKGENGKDKADPDGTYGDGFVGTNFGGAF